MEKITAESFDHEVLNGSLVPVVVDFSAKWCAPCEAFEGVLRTVSEGRDDTKIVQLDIDEAPDLAVKYGIRGLPTVIMYHSGEPVGVRVGAMNQGDINKWIDAGLASLSEK